jgi:hypothetical protein
MTGRPFPHNPPPGGVFFLGWDKDNGSEYWGDRHGETVFFKKGDIHGVFGSDRHWLLMTFHRHSSWFELTANGREWGKAWEANVMALRSLGSGMGCESPQE